MDNKNLYQYNSRTKSQEDIRVQKLWAAVIKRRVRDYKEQNEFAAQAELFLKGIDLDLICSEFLADVVSADYVRKQVFA